MPRALRGEGDGKPGVPDGACPGTYLVATHLQSVPPAELQAPPPSSCAHTSGRPVLEVQRHIRPRIYRHLSSSQEHTSTFIILHSPILHSPLFHSPVVKTLRLCHFTTCVHRLRATAMQTPSRWSTCHPVHALQRAMLTFACTSPARSLATVSKSCRGKSFRTSSLPWATIP